MVVRTLPGPWLWRGKNKRPGIHWPLIACPIQEGTHRMTENLDVSAVTRQVNKLLDEAGVLPCGRAFVLEQLLRSEVRYEEPSRSAS